MEGSKSEKRLACECDLIGPHTHRAPQLLLLGFWRHLLWDEFDWSFDLPSGPLCAVRQSFHSDVSFIAAGLVALRALPVKDKGGGSEWNR